MCDIIHDFDCDIKYRMVRDGHFGFKDYFKSLCDGVEGDSDFYLLGSDFASYLEAQVKLISMAPNQDCVFLWSE